VAPLRPAFAPSVSIGNPGKPPGAHQAPARKFRPACWTNGTMIRIGIVGAAGRGIVAAHLRGYQLVREGRRRGHPDHRDHVAYPTATAEFLRAPRSRTGPRAHRLAISRRIHCRWSRRIPLGLPNRTSTSKSSTRLGPTRCSRGSMRSTSPPRCPSHHEAGAPRPSTAGKHCMIQKPLAVRRGGRTTDGRGRPQAHKVLARGDGKSALITARPVRIRAAGFLDEGLLGEESR